MNMVLRKFSIRILKNTFGQVSVDKLVYYRTCVCLNITFVRGTVQFTKQKHNSIISIIEEKQQQVARRFSSQHLVETWFRIFRKRKSLAKKISIEEAKTFFLVNAWFEINRETLRKRKKCGMNAFKRNAVERGNLRALFGAWKREKVRRLEEELKLTQLLLKQSQKQVQDQKSQSERLRTMLSDAKAELEQVNIKNTELHIENQTLKKENQHVRHDLRQLRDNRS